MARVTTAAVRPPVRSRDGASATPLSPQPRHGRPGSAASPRCRNDGRSPAVGDDSAVADGEVEQSGRSVASVVPEEVAQPVRHVRGAEPARGLQPVAVGSYHGSGAGTRERCGQRLLPGGDLGRVLLAPVEIDHHRGSIGRGPFNGTQQGRSAWSASSCQPRRARACLPVRRRALQEGVVGSEEGELLSPQGDPVWRERLGTIAADAENGNRGGRLDPKRVGQSLSTEVDPVVVGHRDGVDASCVQRLERRWPGPEVVAVVSGLQLLGVAGTPVRESGLQVHHGEVRGGGRCLDRVETRLWFVEELAKVILEHHVTTKRQPHRPRRGRFTRRLGPIAPSRLVSRTRRNLDCVASRGR